MDLFALPDFHHTFLLLLALAVILFIALLFLRSKRTPKKEIPKDIYEISMELQRLSPNDPEAKELLSRLAPYKYRQEDKIPKELRKELLKYYKRVRKKSYNRVNPLKRIGHEKVGAFFRTVGSAFRRRL